MNDLLENIENIKTKISDQEYIDLMNNLKHIHDMGGYKKVLLEIDIHKIIVDVEYDDLDNDLPIVMFCRIVNTIDNITSVIRFLEDEMTTDDINLRNFEKVELHQNIFTCFSKDFDKYLESLRNFRTISEEECSNKKYNTRNNVYVRILRYL